MLLHEPLQLLPYTSLQLPILTYLMKVIPVLEDQTFFRGEIRETKRVVPYLAARPAVYSPISLQYYRYILANLPLPPLW